MIINDGDQHSKYLLQDGNTLNIFRDEINDQDPRREYDNLGKMICFHRRYNLGDKTDLRSSEFSSWADLKKHIINRCDPAVVIPVFMIDHSGIAIRAERNFSDVDPGCWDSGQIGFIYADKKTIREWFNVKKITKKSREKARENLLSEIETYNDYLTGNVYGYTITDPTGEILDSCYGFFGDPEKTIIPEFSGQIVPDNKVFSPVKVTG
jgi:hypothetical protein